MLRGEIVPEPQATHAAQKAGPVGGNDLVKPAFGARLAPDGQVLGAPDGIRTTDAQIRSLCQVLRTSVPNIRRHGRQANRYATAEHMESKEGAFLTIALLLVDRAKSALEFVGGHRFGSCAVCRAQQPRSSRNLISNIDISAIEFHSRRRMTLRSFHGPQLIDRSACIDRS
jgi:hypothetical protein